MSKMAAGWIVHVTFFFVLMSAVCAKHVKNCDRGTFKDFPDKATNDGICVVSGDPHFVTFDGLRFDFQGICGYKLMYLLQDDFLVDINGYFQRSKYHHGASVMKELNFYGIDISGEGGEYQFHLDSDFNVYIGFGRNQEKLLVSTEFSPNIKIDLYCNAVVIQFGILHLYWGHHHKVIIQVPKIASSAGLCGNYNGIKVDDLEVGHLDFATDAVSLGKWFEADLEGYECKACEDCTSKSFCQSNPHNEKEAKRQCSALFADDSPSCLRQHRDYVLRTPAEWSSKCEALMCASLPQMDGLCYTGLWYIIACGDAGEKIPDSFTNILNSECEPSA